MKTENQVSLLLPGFTCKDVSQRKNCSKWHKLFREKKAEHYVTLVKVPFLFSLCLPLFFLPRKYLRTPPLPHYEFSLALYSARDGTNWLVPRSFRNPCPHKPCAIILPCECVSVLSVLTCYVLRVACYV